MDVQENEVPEGLKILIYRVFQEAFNNIIKHSGADTVRVEFTKDSQYIILTIQDNGKGFNLEKSIMGGYYSQGLGILGMKERVNNLGGIFHIESKQGKGTRISVEIPLTS